MAYPHKCVLLIGATSGIGLAMAEKFVAWGSKVIVVGRRKDRLDSFVAKHGSDKAASEVLDITETGNIPNFVKIVTSKHPEIDNVFLNAGIMNHGIVSQPDTLDLQDFHMTMQVNFTGIVNVVTAFLPFLKSKPTATSLTFTGTIVSVVPGIGFAAYCASKSALNIYIMCLRQELKDEGSRIQVVETFVPPVQTEIHDRSLGGGMRPQFGMPVNEFADAAYALLVKGEEQPMLGSLGDRDRYVDFINTRMELFGELNDLIKANN